MQVTKFSHGMLTLTLTADDCATLAHCLTAAMDSGAFDRAGQEAEATICESMATAFTLGAVAGVSSGWVALRDHDDVTADLEAVGLGRLVGSDAPDVLTQAARALGA